MVSAQVLPNSRKQEHWEAGKRRLEEFRKKKAAEKSKKAASVTLVPSTAYNSEKCPSDTEIFHGPDSDEVGTSSVAATTVNQLSTTETTNGGNSSVFLLSNKLGSDIDLNVQSGPVNGIGPFGSYAAHTNGIEPAHKIYGGLESRVDFIYSNKEENELKSDLGLRRASLGFSSDHSITLPNQDYTKRSTATTGYVGGSTSGMLNKSQFDGTLNFQERKLGNSFSGLPGVEGAASHIRDHSSTAFYSTFSSSPNHLPLHLSNAETQPQRSRPSFLDSLKVQRGPPVLPLTNTPSEESVNSSNFNGLDILESSGTSRYSSDIHLAPLSKPTPDLSPFPTVTPSTSFYINNIQSQRSNFNEPNMETKHDFLRPKPNEDFSALEQHIEDLTQEKFSLQRSIEASRTLAESLAAENTSLTDSYNQQRNAVNQLKEGMEKLQVEINAQLVELEAMKNAYTNAQLECNAADERAKLLASEVIGLEEKALRLRSSELKLERQLENSLAEISTYKKKVASLEKERQDLQSTVSALLEEKKMLQSKVRKASSGGNSIDMNLAGIKRKEMSTSTEDLDKNYEQVLAGRLLDESEISSFSLPDGAQLNLEDASVFIPTDHTRVIVNINTLISELAFEKEELLKALESEKADNIKMKVLNKELSQKLETQTQRLELLTAQSMGPENLTLRLRDAPVVTENAPFADEGDEVVERVLGWIMMLFPGGPSRQRPSKHL